MNTKKKSRGVLGDQRPISPGRWARSLRGKRYRISPCSPLKQEVSEIYRYLHANEKPLQREKIDKEKERAREGGRERERPAHHADTQG
jgi:hypothetical protein